MSKEKQKKSLLDLVTAEKLQEVNSNKKGLEELGKLKQELAEKDKEIEKLNKRIKKQKEEIGNKIDTFIDSYGDSCVETGDLWLFIENQIEQLKEGK